MSRFDGPFAVDVDDGLEELLALLEEMWMLDEELEDVCERVNSKGGDA